MLKIIGKICLIIMQIKYFVETGFIFLMQNISWYSFDFRGGYVILEIRPDITLITV